jgi:hypothetical protein
MTAQGHFRQIDPLPTLSACPLRSHRVRTFAPQQIDAVCHNRTRALQQKVVSFVRANYGADLALLRDAAAGRRSAVEQEASQPNTMHRVFHSQRRSAVDQRRRVSSFRGEPRQPALAGFLGQ